MVLLLQGKQEYRRVLLTKVFGDSLHALFLYSSDSEVHDRCCQIRIWRETLPVSATQRMSSQRSNRRSNYTPSAIPFPTSKQTKRTQVQSARPSLEIPFQ